MFEQQIVELELALRRMTERVARLEELSDRTAAERKDAPMAKSRLYLPTNPVVAMRYYLSESYALNWQGQWVLGYWVTWNGQNWVTDDHIIVLP